MQQGAFRAAKIAKMVKRLILSSNRPRGYTCVGKRGIAEVYPRKYSIFKLRIGEVRVIKSKKRRLGLPPFRAVKKFPKLSFFMNMSAILFYRRREQWR